MNNKIYMLHPFKNLSAAKQGAALFLNANQGVDIS
jgi:hypothetical protein